jgi:hypothetical protein
MSHTRTIRRITTRAAFASCLALSQFACADAGPAPTAAEIDQVMHGRWDRQATTSTPKATVTINSVKVGSTNTANQQDVIDGIPPGAAVTAALIDFTVRSYYSDSIEVVRRMREASIYRDKFGAWDVKTGSPRGQDSTTSEPLIK